MGVYYRDLKKSFLIFMMRLLCLCEGDGKGTLVWHHPGTESKWMVMIENEREILKTRELKGKTIPLDDVRI